MSKRPKAKVHTTPVAKAKGKNAIKKSRHAKQVVAAECNNMNWPELTPWELAKKARRQERIRKGYPKRWAAIKRWDAAGQDNERPSVANTRY